MRLGAIVLAVCLVAVPVSVAAEDKGIEHMIEQQNILLAKMHNHMADQTFYLKRMYLSLISMGMDIGQIYVNTCKNKKNCDAMITRMHKHYEKMAKQVLGE